MSKTSEPTNLLEAIRYFSDLDVATEFVAKRRWPHGPVCSRCGCMDYSYLTTRRVWKCKGCKKQYSVKVGTIFEDSPLGFDRWLPAVWLIANSKNGISSHELARSLGITQKSAWFMLHRIRLAMQTGSFDKLDGEVEADETYIGGRARNMHKAERKKKIKGRGQVGKTTLMGIKQREGETRAKIIEGTSGGILKAEVAENVEPGSAVLTDTHGGDSSLGSMGFDHETVDHMESYVNGRAQTNGLENFWALLKRSLDGTYVSVDPEHLARHLDERLLPTTCATAPTEAGLWPFCKPPPDAGSPGRP